MESMMPNTKFDHVYAIVRVDAVDSSECLRLPDTITVKKIMKSKEAAEQEVLRLNAVNSSKGCVYFTQLTRLER